LEKILGGRKMKEKIKETIELEGFNLNELCNCEQQDIEFKIVLADDLTLILPYCANCKKLITNEIEITGGKK